MCVRTYVVCAYAYIFVCLHVYIHACAYVCMRACMYVCVYVRVCVCAHACMCACMYRADWEPEAPSGKCMAGVPGVSWRCPAVLWGPSTPPIQRWFQGKSILLKVGQFSLYACGNGVDLPHVAKHAFGDQMGPNVQKAMPFDSPLIKD